MPPEFFDNQVITLRFDVYSLGATIMEIVTGQKGYDDTENILESWRNKLETQQVDIMLKQVRACVDIGKQCLEYNPAKRPTIQNIMDTLNETGSMGCSADSSMSSSSVEQIVRMKGYRKVVYVDVHSAKPWIVITHFEGPFRVWNYQTEAFVMSLDATREQEGKAFLTAKFIERTGWIVAGGCDGYIYVFDCNNTMKKVHSFEALTEQITSLAIHPTKPYVLSASYDFEIGLWEWTNGWKSVQKFKNAHSGSVTQIAFDPKDDNAFASASMDGTVKIWKIGCPKYSKKLIWHSDSKKKVKVRCLDYFTRENKQYLITGAGAGKAKIWGVPVQELSGHQNNKRVSAVCSHPELPLLMTGSRDGTVCVWNSNTFRLERTLKFSLKVHSLGCIKGSRRVVIGHSEGITIVELDKESCSS